MTKKSILIKNTNNIIEPNQQIIIDVFDELTFWSNGKSI